MPFQKKRKIVEENDCPLSKVLRTTQNENEKIINKKEEELKNCASNPICEGTEIICNAVIDNLPGEFLDMKYSEFLKQMSGISFNIGKPNDTLTAIENLRSRVVSGVASPGEISKYRELKKLL
ncbi:Hypothetical protein SRAE_1000293900 [Strongyloides ratti]|uniref:Uncharacterized protein n=1 Tax=Strongyloides ratti TaxID=34506 RepID=A0A090L4J8_STRRB|nr:Hypothetical protein SRAE_1000293900 [Strongyloides ratti]CEF64686.1 Hypothetical protein SRAE_1000293900 [Strongyloides ratti]